MSGIAPSFARNDADRLLPLRSMMTNRALRKRIRTLVDHGLSQKVIAAKMGTSESWLSRFLKNDSKASLTVDHMDALNDYLRELSALIQEAQPPAPSAPTGATFSEANGTTGVAGPERER